MGKLTTHVLDTAQGKPGAGVKLALYSVGAHGKVRLKADQTDADGRCATPLLEGAALQASPRFLDVVTLAFGVADPEQNYHVPLLISPWSYSTYRGS